MPELPGCGWHGWALPTSEDCGEILRMRVHPAHQGKGFGRQLLHALEDSARASGIRVLHLETTTQQIAAGKLYQRNSYQIEGRARTAGFDTKQLLK